MIQEKHFPTTGQKVAQQARELDAQLIVVGHPLNMDGSCGDRAKLCEEFADKLFEQITDLGADVEIERATRIEKRGEGDFFVHTEFGGDEAKRVIIAAGVKHRHLKTKEEREDLVGKGVYYCAVCDGPFYKGREVAVIGDAHSALPYALLL